MKKIAGLSVLVILLGCLSGCAVRKQTEKLQIVCTIFPAYDWVKSLVGEDEDVSVTLLIDGGTDLHRYQPSAADLIQISACDLLVYVGGPSDQWVKEALESSQNPSRKTLALMDLAPKEETGGEVDRSTADPLTQDEHIWLSITAAQASAAAIEEQLCQLDPAHQAQFQASGAQYQNALSSLQQQYLQAMNTSSRKTLLFADRFPFYYLAKDYHLQYFAAFLGCSTATAADFQAISFLSQKVDELRLPVVLVLEDSDQAIAHTVIANTRAKNQKILVMNAMQTVTPEDIAAGESYLNIMKENLAALTSALH